MICAFAAALAVALLAAGPSTGPHAALAAPAGVAFDAVSAGRFHTCAVKYGGVSCWGDNQLGQLGNNNAEQYSPVPTAVIGLASGVDAITSGGDHACAIADGGASCWGNNDFGQLGNGSAQSCGSSMCARVPAAVPGLTSGVTAISAGGPAISTGESHTCAVKDGGAFCWGDDDNGQIGSPAPDTCAGSYPCAKAPLAVPGMAAGVTAISAGGSHTCAVKDGAAWCWGDNTYGQLGDSSTTDSTSPVAVNGLDSNVTAISAGLFHTCAIKDGGALCWGRNNYGQLGDNTTTNSSVPVAVSGLGTGVSAIDSGSDHACALSGGGASCWGSNTHGQLGDNSTTDSAVPVPVSGLGSGVGAVSAGTAHTCALTGPVAHCWGENFGRLGNGSNTESHVPVEVTRGISAMAAGVYHTCALQDGGVWCWGGGFIGSSVPVPIAGLESGVSAISAGVLNTCALKDDGVWCWGDNFFGSLGNNDAPNDSAVPVQVQGLGAGVAAISAAGYHTCALKEGSAWCWGANYDGQLGTGSNTQSNVPVPVSGLPGDVIAIAAGGNTTCALRGGGAGVWCWGSNNYGNLGDGSVVGENPTPVQVSGSVGTSWQGVTVGLFHSCMWGFDVANCWGYNLFFGQLGDGSTTSSSVPTTVSLPATISGLGAGDHHTCAIRNGGVYCWGINDQGQLGNDNPPTSSPTPVAVSGLSSGVTAIAVGINHACALQGGVAWCWGQGTYTQMGNGTSTATNAVPLLPSWDGDSDGCTDQEENGGAGTEVFGGDRDRFDPWDFYDVTDDKSIDLADVIAILGHFGDPPAGNELYDRYFPDQSKRWRTAYAGDGIDVVDAIANLQSFGHSCAASP